MTTSMKIVFASEEEKRIMKIQDLALDFAKRIVELFKHLKYNAKEYVISNQILRSGTSIGANVLTPISQLPTPMSPKKSHF